MTLSSLAGVAVTRARVQIPGWGRAWADVQTTDDAGLAVGARITLTLADIALVCTVVSGGVYEGRARYRLVTGSNGWARDARAIGESNDAGVRANVVLEKLAREVNETLEGAPTTRLGPHYARLAGPACLTLSAIAPRSWRVDLDGVTRFGDRAASTYAGPAVRTRVDRAFGLVELATETLAGLVPGVMIDDMPPATDVEIELDASRLTARVYTGARLSRRLAALRSVVSSLFPELRFRGVFEARVVSQTGERFTVQPVRAASGLPDLARVSWRGPAGVRATVVPGELVLVAFVDSDPARPVIIAHDSPDSPAWLPLENNMFGAQTRIGASSAAAVLGIAYQGSAVVAGPFGGTVTLGSLTAKVSP